MKQAMQVLTSSETAEWYTPKVYTDAAREVMGGIELDPASCEAANEWIKATEFFTEKDDGLSYPWVVGSVFLNPPYGKTGSRSNQEIWAEKLVEEYYTGNVGQAVLLTKSVPGYKWWDKLFNYYMFPVCFCSERIRFLRLNEFGRVVAEGQAKAGSNFWYLGHNVDKFDDVFSKFGRVVLI